ncbi:Uncharacterised protein [Legionella busanensis]|uniref:Uncharacterized protein n=1 Tax=Legionella busanensis TaxID=190655 RepID=A0A378JXB0_9GAMM|nr:Uncharacterised protein [Legionella busanensis]
MDEKILKTNSPEAVVVSIAPSHNDLNPTPFSRKVSMSVTKCTIERSKRSSRQTTKTSPADNFSKHSFNPGRSVLELETLSLKIRFFASPLLGGHRLMSLNFAQGC